MYSNSQNNNFSPSSKDLKGLSCEICFEAYNSGNKQPLSLPSCGHTFCSSCLKDFQNKCPTCRTSFQESQVQKNYALLGLLDELGREEEKCLVHKREVDRFCRSCLKLMCSVCHCQHLGSANIISDMNLRDEIKEIQKSLMETQIQEKILREKIDMGFQTKVKEIEKEEAQSRKTVQKTLELETLRLYSEEKQLIWKAEEDAKQKIKLIEEQKQKVIDEVKKRTREEIKTIEAMQKASLESILSQKMTLLSPIQALNSQILQKLQVFKDFKQVKCDTLTECANLYQLWKQKKSEMATILMLKNDSAELLFDKLQGKVQIRVSEEDKKPSENKVKSIFKDPRYRSQVGQSNSSPKQIDSGRNGQFSSRSGVIFEEYQRPEFQIGDEIDFCDRNGEWTNAQIIYNTGNRVTVKSTHQENTEYTVADIDDARILKRWKKGGKFQINNLLEVIDTVNKWCIARVMKLSEYEIFIHYEGWSTKYDEWLPKNSERIAELGTYTLKNNL